MNFSIIIPTNNRIHHVSILIKQLVTQSYTDGLFEIIVVDNSTTKSAIYSLKHFLASMPNTRILHVRNRGPSWARNAGLRISKFAHVIFLDDDIRIHPNFLNSYKKAWKKYPHASLIGGQITPHHSALSSSSQQRKYQRSLIQQFGWVFACTPKSYSPRRLELGDFLYSANLSFHKKTLSLKKPLFHQVLGSVYLGVPLYAEDFELCCRLLLDHHELWYDPSIRVQHAFNTARFSRLYILKRHIIAGPEQFLMDTALCLYSRQFIYFTHIYNVFLEIKDLIRLRNARIWQRISNSMTLSFTVSYFFIGPMICLYAYIISNMNYRLASHGE